MKRSHVLFTTAALALSMAAPAMAHSILIGPNPTVTNIGPANNMYTYSPFVTTSSSVQQGTLNSALTTYSSAQGDFFVLVDFQGYIDHTAFAPAGWTVTVAGAFGNPLGGNQYSIQTGSLLTNTQQFNDDPTIPDLLFTDTTAGAYPGQMNLGAFGGNSTNSKFTLDAILEAQDHSGGETVGNADLYLAPGVSALPGTPLPASVWGGLTLMGLAGGTRILRRRRA